MSPQPALFVILDTVIANLRAVNGYGAPMSGATIPVYDGPELAATDDNPLSYVCVGWTPNGDESGAMQTSGAVFGAQASRLEDGTFNVTIVSSSGDTDGSTVRATLRDIAAQVVTSAYGLTASTFAAYWCEVNGMELRQDQTPAGFTATAVISFSYRVQQGA